ncbi:hypothetical protein DBV15_11301 [Temnothorax longispinosus]|uniref:Uncharacterized protein n=1 Tax=Temnothorax longispinosus TaxID=300112 RepID=A0A4S2KA07_9HYME|nr:hypothetical protein DBV15_11301 [Temnothorax longispinosus]
MRRRCDISQRWTTRREKKRLIHLVCTPHGRQLLSHSAVAGYRMEMNSPGPALVSTKRGARMVLFDDDASSARSICGDPYVRAIMDTRPDGAYGTIVSSASTPAEIRETKLRGSHPGHKRERSSRQKRERKTRTDDRRCALVKLVGTLIREIKFSNETYSPDPLPLSPARPPPGSALPLAGDTMNSQNDLSPVFLAAIVLSEVADFRANNGSSFLPLSRMGRSGRESSERGAKEARRRSEGVNSKENTIAVERDIPDLGNSQANSNRRFVLFTITNAQQVSRSRLELLFSPRLFPSHLRHQAPIIDFEVGVEVGHETHRWRGKFLKVNPRKGAIFAKRDTATRGNLAAQRGALEAKYPRRRGGVVIPANRKKDKEKYRREMEQEIGRDRREGEIEEKSRRERGAGRKEGRKGRLPELFGLGSRAVTRFVARLEPDGSEVDANAGRISTAHDGPARIYSAGPTTDDDDDEDDYSSRRLHGPVEDTGQTRFYRRMRQTITFLRLASTADGCGITTVTCRVDQHSPCPVSFRNRDYLHMYVGNSLKTCSSYEWLTRKICDISGRCSGQSRQAEKPVREIASRDSKQICVFACQSARAEQHIPANATLNMAYECNVCDTANRTVRHKRPCGPCVSQQSDYRSLINAVAFRGDRVSATSGSGGNGKIEFRADRKYEGAGRTRGSVPHGRIVAEDSWTTRVPGVPLAGCVLRLGRAINCEVLFGKEERGQGGGDKACIFNARILCLAPPFPFYLPLSLMHTRARIGVRHPRFDDNSGQPFDWTTGNREQNFDF